jgi:Protein of unknown function (DUF3108)
MNKRHLVLLFATTLFFMSCGGSVLADPTTEAPAAKVPPKSRVAKKDKFPRHKNVKLKLTAGEKLTYAIKWGAVDAGMATLTVKRKEELGPSGPKVWNIQCKTRSNAFVSMFYEVRDDIKSLIDVKGGFTRLFNMDKNEGNYHATERIEFDYKAMEAKYVKIKKKLFSEKKRTKIIKLPARAVRVQDPLSCLYYARGLDLKVGSKHKITVNTSKKNWVMTLEVLREETQTIKGLGKVKCLVIEPKAQFQGLFVRKGKMTIWVEKQTKIPLKMTVKIPIGSASAILIKAENSPLSKLARNKDGKKSKKK